MQAETVQAYRLSADPPIFIGPTRLGCPLGPASILAPALGKRRACSFVFVEWTLEDRAMLAEAVTAYARHMDEFPEHSVTFLCATPVEAVSLADRGISAVRCSSNLLVRECAGLLRPRGARAAGLPHSGARAAAARRLRQRGARPAR